MPLVDLTLILGNSAGVAWLGAGIPAALPWMIGAAVQTALQLANGARVRRHRTSGVLMGGAVASAGGTPLAHTLAVTCDQPFSVSATRNKYAYTMATITSRTAFT